MPTPRNKPLLRQIHKRQTPAQEKAQTEIAFAAIRRLYCAALPLWTGCTRGYCRRHRRCGAADGKPCLKRIWPQLSERAQQRAYQDVVAGGPRRLPPASDLEKLLRRYPPTNFVL